MSFKMAQFDRSHTSSYWRFRAAMIPSRDKAKYGSKIANFIPHLHSAPSVAVLP